MKKSVINAFFYRFKSIEKALKGGDLWIPLGLEKINTKTLTKKLRKNGTILL